MAISRQIQQEKEYLFSSEEGDLLANSLHHSPPTALCPLEVVCSKHLECVCSEEGREPQVPNVIVPREVQPPESGLLTYSRRVKRVLPVPLFLCQTFSNLA